MESLITDKPSSCLESEQECANCVAGCAVVVRRISPGIDRVALHRIFSEMFTESACRQMFPIFLNAYQTEVRRKGPGTACPSTSAHSVVECPEFGAFAVA
jgi:hypothetical protein